MRRLAAGPALFALALAGCGGGGHAHHASTTAASTPVHVALPSAAKTTVARYFAALGSSDAQGACGQLTPESRRELAEFADALRLGRRSCTATYKTLFASPASGPGLRAEAKAKIVSVAPGKAGALAVRLDGVDGLVTLVQDAGTWRISSKPSVEADKLPGAKPDNGDDG